MEGKRGGMDHKGRVVFCGVLYPKFIDLTGDSFSSSEFILFEPVIGSLLSSVSYPDLQGSMAAVVELFGLYVYGCWRGKYGLCIA